MFAVKSRAFAYGGSHKSLMQRSERNLFIDDVKSTLIIEHFKYNFTRRLNDAARITWLVACATPRKGELVLHTVEDGFRRTTIWFQNILRDNLYTYALLTSDISIHLYIIFIVHVCISDLLDRMGRRSQGSCVQYFVASRGTCIFSRTMKLWEMKELRIAWTSCCDVMFLVSRKQNDTFDCRLDGKLFPDPWSLCSLL